MLDNIALIGFMGSGKSTVGRQLAQQLGWRFTDTDSLIERVAGCSIPTLFVRDGELAFRVAPRAPRPIGPVDNAGLTR